MSTGSKGVIDSQCKLGHLCDMCAARGSQLFSERTHFAFVLFLLMAGAISLSSRRQICRSLWAFYDGGLTSGAWVAQAANFTHTSFLIRATSSFMCNNFLKKSAGSTRAPSQLVKYIINLDHRCREGRVCKRVVSQQFCNIVLG